MRSRKKHNEDKTEGLDFSDALKWLKKGFKVKLPEWNGYWFKEGDKLKLKTANGEVLNTPDIKKFIFREDWIVLID